MVITLALMIGDVLLAIFNNFLFISISIKE